MNPTLVAATLSLVAYLETNNGTLTAHPTIQNPASIHFGTAAVGRWGLMPNTLKSLGFSKHQEELAAKKLARITLHNTRGCKVVAAVILWEQGHNIKNVTAKHWERGNAKQRLAKVTKEFKRFKGSKAYGKRFY